MDTCFAAAASGSAVVRPSGRLGKGPLVMIFFFKSGFGLLFSGDLFRCLYKSGDLVQYENDAGITVKLVDIVHFTLASRLPQIKLSTQRPFCWNLKLTMRSCTKASCTYPDLYPAVIYLFTSPPAVCASAPPKERNFLSSPL